MALFYKNTESDKLKNVNIMNASMDVLQDLDNTTFIDAVEAEFKDCFDRLDLRDNYGILCIPGYLGSNKVVEKWAKFCHKNKVTMVTDFQHLDSPDDVMELFQSANLSGGDVYKSNVVMGANWLIGRPKEVAFGEEEHLHVPPSGALAGKIYQTLMSQVTAGKKHGSLANPHEVRRRIGFLPETPPLYPEMTVQAFLGFVCDLREVASSDKKAKIGDALALTALTLVAGEPIGTLSHGYRQRVGVAQAIVHRPQLVILDEPTRGLDPRQIVEMRKLIHELKDKHTVLLSSHQLAEVSQTCDRLLVLGRGQVVGAGIEAELGALQEPMFSVELTVRVPDGKDGGAAAVLAALGGIDGLLGKSVPTERGDGWELLISSSSPSCSSSTLVTMPLSLTSAVTSSGSPA